MRILFCFLGAGLIGACIDKAQRFDMACFSGGVMIWRGQMQAIVGTSPLRFRDQNGVPHIINADCFASLAEDKAHE